MMLESTLWCAWDVDVLSAVRSLMGRKTDLFDKAVLETEKDCTILASIREKRDASDVGLAYIATKSEGV